MTERKSPFVGKFASYDPVEPLWPYGAVAYMRPIPAEEMSDNLPAIGVQKLAVYGVHRLPDGGWRVTANVFGAARRIVFDVDEDGESAECVPWDDDLEATYAPKPPEPEPVKQKGFLAYTWESIIGGWKFSEPVPEPPTKPVTDSMVEGVKKAAEERDRKRHEFVQAVMERQLEDRAEVERRHRRAEELQNRVVEVLGQADPQPKKEADDTTEVTQDQAAEEEARHEHRA